MELVSLRRVVLAHAAGNSASDAQTLYERHGIDVRAWRDIEVRDHRGRMVDIDLAAPHVAPLGVAAAAELGVVVDLSDLLAGIEAGNAEVHLDGVPPGTLLSCGRNFGDGYWRIGAAECGRELRAFPPAIGAGARTVTARIHAVDDGKVLRNGTVDIGFRDPASALAALIPQPVADGRLPLETGELDPYGRGSAQLTFSDLPPGALLSRGTNHGGGVWTLSSWRGEEIFVTPPMAVHDGSRFSVIATTFDEDNGDTAIVSRDLVVSPDGDVRPIGDAAVV